MKKESWRQSCKNVLNPKMVDSFNSKADKLFATRVPEFYSRNIDFNAPDDPLLLQVLPHKDELQNHPDYSRDAVQDLASNPHKGVIHKYKNRVLLVCTGACAINCRYCFRRHYPYASNHASADRWQKALEYIANDNSINEVILSGGDPLMLSTRLLKTLTDQLQDFDHVKTLRIHSRIPTVAPQRITENLIHWLSDIKLNKVLVLHCNHPKELSKELRNVLTKIKTTGTTLLNQSVLLKSVNDDVSTLKDLSQRLFEFGALPYYLNLLDKVEGATHFYVDDKTAIAIMKSLRKELPGYLLPRLVRDTGSNECKETIF